MSNSEKSTVTRREVVNAIDWMGSGDVIEFDAANWSTVDEDGKVKVEGYAYLPDGRHYVQATFTLGDVIVSYCPEDGE